MSDALAQSMLLGSVSAALIMLVLMSIALLFDRIVVWLDDTFSRRHFLLARQIAAELRRVPDAWVASLVSLSHPGLGIELKVFGGGEVYQVRSSVGSWAPNLFEKRILTRAVRARIRRSLGEQILDTASPAAGVCS